MSGKDVSAPLSLSKSGKNTLVAKRRSTRAFIASEKASVNLAHEKTGDKRKETKKNASKNNKRVHFDAVQLVPAEKVAKGPAKKKDATSDPHVIKDIVTKVCTDVVPEIVSSLINQRQQQNPTKVNVDQEGNGVDVSDSDLDGDGSGSDVDDEDNLRTLALQSVPRLDS